MSQKRIVKVSQSFKTPDSLLKSIQEYGDLQKKPLEGIKISLSNEADMHDWQVLMDGPKGSPYEASTRSCPTSKTNS